MFCVGTHLSLSGDSERTTAMSNCRYLVTNGVISQTSNVPPVASFLEAHPGAYTTTRTHSTASCVLFWDRHLRRLVESARILAETKPEYLFGTENAGISPYSASPSSWDSIVWPLVNRSLRNVLPVALEGRNEGEELAITALVSGNVSSREENRKKERTIHALDVYLHIGVYVPPVFGTKESSAHLAVVGPGRDIANAKFSEWVRLRKCLEYMRPPSTNELMLSNDGDHILEGCLTNFFVVRRKENSDVPRKHPLDLDNEFSFEVQTASISDGVLPGIVRQVIVEVCLAMGISLSEVAPSWSERELWEEAFITKQAWMDTRYDYIIVNLIIGGPGNIRLIERIWLLMVSFHKHLMFLLLPHSLEAHPGNAIIRYHCFLYSAFCS
ncbi:hypothetical protein MKW94_004587 [Papaver nudicaule]|uniref:Uncharacterized protein n=1 Tax=Papaver nudicaule TaxID=74823 RepID=A0AA41UY67_PAPNU|nr:hypothetical protein [Papaver nudicaule]